MKIPTVGLTQSYADYIKSLPPSEQIDEAQSAVDWLNANSIHAGDSPYRLSSVLERSEHGPPYNTHTHTTYYYYN